MKWDEASVVCDSDELLMMMMNDDDELLMMMVMVMVMVMMAVTLTNFDRLLCADWHVVAYTCWHGSNCSRACI